MPPHDVCDNFIIQGDNLEALKSLLPFYAGQVKCIYIDPPYNTGSAFDGAIARRAALEKDAQKEREYIRPILLFQAQSKDKAHNRRSIKKLPFGNRKHPGKPNKNSHRGTKTARSLSDLKNFAANNRKILQFMGSLRSLQGKKCSKPCFSHFFYRKRAKPDKLLDDISAKLV